MRGLCRSAPLILLLGAALAGCNSKGPPGGGTDGGKPGESPYQITGPNQVILHVEGIS